MVFIYCIEDINDLKYVGSTTDIKRRFRGHKQDKNRGRSCSSRLLHLEHSIIYQLEECKENERKEREKYWINKLDCVNQKKLNGENKELSNIAKLMWHHKNKDEINRKRRERYQINKSKEN